MPLLGVRLFRHAATLTRLGDVFYRADLKGLGSSAPSSCRATRRSAAARRGGRGTRSACDLDFVADVLAQLGVVARQLITGAVLVSQGVAAVGATQATLNAGFAARVCGRCLTRSRRVRIGLAGAILRHGPGGTEQQH